MLVDATFHAIADAGSIPAVSTHSRERLRRTANSRPSLPRQGLSNPEIGARLFVSPRTVQYHLHKVFTKLNISSRNQLDRALPGGPTAAQPT